MEITRRAYDARRAAWRERARPRADAGGRAGWAPDRRLLRLGA